MLTAECQLERFLLENPPNEKNIDKATVELPNVQQELIKVLEANPKVRLTCIHLIAMMSRVEFFYCAKLAAILTGLFLF